VSRRDTQPVAGAASGGGAARDANAAGSDLHHVVIIGSGFGGLFAARALKQAPVRVTLIDRTNHHLFQPLLYQVATGILSSGQIAPPTRDVLRNHPRLRVVLAEVERIDLEARRVHADEFGEALAVPYDSLIVAGGAATSYFGHDEFRHYACGMKSLDDALELRGNIFGSFELAEAERDAAVRRRLMTFVVVGGGPTGVEMAGQLEELSHRALRRNYRSIDPREARVVLVEGTGRLVGSMGRRLSAMTERDLRRLGVEIHLDAMVTDMDDDGVEITKADGSTERIEAAVKVWAAGTRAAGLGSILAGAAGVDVDKAGRVCVEPDCSLPGHPEVFVVGDLMALDDLPGVAEVAIQSGIYAARAIVRRVEGKPSKPFRYRDLGTLAAISRFRAVAKIGPLRVGGFVGWMLWLVVHITFLTGFKNRLGALARWTVSFVGRGRYERALTGRWVARRGRRAEGA
jgi:NADH:ubiquinone reductase (H+-translocating)